MRRRTEVVGHLHVQPALSQAEIALVNALGCGGLRERSHWRACAEGCCLSFDGDEVAPMVRWLRHLMTTYLVCRGRRPRHAPGTVR